MVNVTNIHYLAVFICNLFVDGRFRTAHFLFKPNTFDFDLLTQFDSICTKSIPVYLTDVTQPWILPWDDMDSPDNVLQLCFFDRSESTNDILQLQSKAYYRIFSFHSNDSFGRGRQTALKALRHFSDSKTLIVLYNSKNVSVFTKFHQQTPIFVVKNEINLNDVDSFDRTLGEIERMQSIAIQRIKFCDTSVHGIDFDWGSTVEIIWMHYYHFQLNGSFINMTWYDLDESPNIETYRYCTLQSSNYYKEVLFKYECSANGNS